MKLIIKYIPIFASLWLTQRSVFLSSWDVDDSSDVSSNFGASFPSHAVADLNAGIYLGLS